MAKNKAELQSDAIQYREAVVAMRAAHRERRILDAIKIAVDSFDYVDGMMQFERRFEDRSERRSVETINYILRYAPLVFDQTSLDKLGDVLKSRKRIDKYATADLTDNLRRANELMWDAHRLWTLLEHTTVMSQDKLRASLGGDQDRWRNIAETWDEIGLIERIPERCSYRIILATRTSAIVRGKCPKCGATGKAPMGTLLEVITCPKCNVASTFVILSMPAAATM
jgi:hypothetical protein